MVSFVILNYKSLEDTIECIKSIKKLRKNKDISIIVVDNATMTANDIIKIKKYTKDLVLLKENIGFANGNNKGCSYAIKKYNPDFLCVINSDTVITQTDFVSRIYSLYQQYQFDILGPKILPDKSESCNPFKVFSTLKEIEDRIIYTKRLIKIYNNCFLRTILDIYIKIKSIFKKKEKHTNGEKTVTGVPLHGCALIFSKKYYEKFPSIFYPKTFLFHEEEFLYLRSIQNNLITLYSPNIDIIHKEGQSINKLLNKDKYKVLIFRNTEILKSLEILKGAIKKEKKI